ncbi:NACHT domain-containing NTPase [Streptomyces sp. TS71-3]|uniref:NACHT domain-containing protein n=1 Tax=Streptomyces sp. TS71-3 TaxID=2733862 RepID=UPI001B017698|nr:NACHT domain-containing protein [Streptomyces sp. TS71-3]GHJ34705.1 ATP-binding protein [Streptomyces sp. TS71-3]
MEPAVLGSRLASSLMTPLVRKLFVAPGPGAGLADRPVRLGRLVSFRGEQRTLTERDVRGLARTLVDRATDAPGERPFPADEQEAVVEAVTRALLAFGELDMDDVQAVRLGHRDLARTLLAARRYDGGPPPRDGLSADAALFVESAVEWACLHVLHFFTQRSTFVARTLVEQSRGQAELIARVDELIRRTPLPDTRDATFERAYRAYIRGRHGRLTIYGIDLSNSPGRWPLDAAYLSLEATAPEPVVYHGAGPEEHIRHPHPTGPAPADQALAAHQRVLLRGAAGSGKTTLAQWLAVSAVAEEPSTQMAYLNGRVPFVLPLRTLTRHGERLPSPAGFLAAVGSPLAGSQPDGWEARVLAAGRGLLLVDGIDEVPEAERARARAWLGELAETYPGNRWLVTSRPSAVRENWLADDRFTELTLTAMNPSGVAAFIRRWHTAARTGDPAEDAQLDAYETQLLDAVRGKPDLGRLATNPLMCGLVCALHRDRRGYLPHGRKELYESALSMLLTRRDRERDMAGPELSEEPQLQLLQRLAYWLIRNGRTEMDRERAERTIAEVLPAVPAAAALGDAPDVLRHFLVRTGLLREPAPGTVDFVHRTFQDYLGARAAVESGDFGLLAEHAADDQWADVIRMAVAQGRPRERAELLRLLLEAGDVAPDDRTRARAHLLAMACLEHATELDPAVRAAVEERASGLIPPRSDDDARALAEVGPLVLELLPGPDGLSDEEAVRVTGTAVLIGTEAALPVLARFRSFPASRVRVLLSRAWDRYDTDQFADELLSGLRTDDIYISAHSREQLRALVRLGLRPRLNVYGDYTAEELLNHLPSGIRDLSLLDNEKLGSLRFLKQLGALRRLTLARCPNVADLSPLAETAIHDLSLRGLPGVRGLGGLTALTSLMVNQQLPGSCLDALPQEAPLTLLNLDNGAVATTGLRGLSRWVGLKHLALGEEMGPLEAGDWAEVASLPELRTLFLHRDALPALTAVVPLPGVEHLTVYPVNAGTDLTALPRLLPSVREVRLNLDGSDGSSAEHYTRVFPDVQVTLVKPLTSPF